VRIGIRTDRRARREQLEAHVAKQARDDLAAHHPGLRLGPVVALIAAYEEAPNIGAVLARMPSSACGLRVTPLVVVDGGEDGTEDVVRSQGVAAAKLPINMGQGVALRVGYAIAADAGAPFVVTLDADGQNDPRELERLLDPVVAGEAELCIGSRRLGQDLTSDRVRKLGVRVFGSLLTILVGTRLTDTSNGFRAFRADLVRQLRLEQNQYQTAELIIAAGAAGWRIVERPVTWLPRASGQSKKGRNIVFGLRYLGVILRTWWREHRNATWQRHANRQRPPAALPDDRAGKRASLDGHRASARSLEAGHPGPGRPTRAEATEGPDTPAEQAVEQVLPRAEPPEVASQPDAAAKPSRAAEGRA
jgi:hypothetical protein